MRIVILAAVVVLLFWAYPTLAEEAEPTPYLELTWLPEIEWCYEFLYSHEDPCPEGYGPITINTPTSDDKAYCKESFGAVIECGRVVSHTLSE